MSPPSSYPDFFPPALFSFFLFLQIFLLLFHMFFWCQPPKSIPSCFFRFFCSLATSASAHTFCPPPLCSEFFDKKYHPPPTPLSTPVSSSLVFFSCPPTPPPPTPLPHKPTRCASYVPFFSPTPAFGPTNFLISHPQRLSILYPVKHSSPPISPPYPPPCSFSCRGPPSSLCLEFFCPRSESRAFDRPFSSSLCSLLAVPPPPVVSFVAKKPVSHLCSVSSNSLRRK